jgi:hypothetical protein
VSGFGDKKVQMYGKQILEAIQNFRQGQRADSSWRAKPSRPAEETLKMLAEGRTFDEIAKTRQRTLRAVVSLVADLIERGKAVFQPGWLPPERYNQIAAACQRLGMGRLKPLKEALPAEIPYEEIRLVIAWAGARLAAPAPPRLGCARVPIFQRKPSQRGWAVRGRCAGRGAGTGTSRRGGSPRGRRCAWRFRGEFCGAGRRLRQAIGPGKSGPW